MSEPVNSECVVASASTRYDDLSNDPCYYISHRRLYEDMQYDYDEHDSGHISDMVRLPNVATIRQSYLDAQLQIHVLLCEIYM